ncbi:unnamed protein product, partial [Laminaria digitata]
LIAVSTSAFSRGAGLGISLTESRGKMGRCSNHFCKTRASYSAQGSKRAAYCKKHAEDGMVNVQYKRCSRDTCTRKGSVNVEGSKTAAYCRHHDKDGMVNVGRRQ